MIVLDTTVLVYAVGSDHPLRDPCRRCVELVRDGQLRARTTVEVVQEFTHIRARRRSRSESVTRAREYAAGLAPLVRPDEKDLDEGLAIFQASDDLGVCDAVLAATARRRGWGLASTDRSFGQVADLTYLDPSSPSFLDDASAVGGW